MELGSRAAHLCWASHMWRGVRWVKFFRRSVMYLIQHVLQHLPHLLLRPPDPPPLLHSYRQKNSAQHHTHHDKSQFCCIWCIKLDVSQDWSDVTVILSSAWWHPKRPGSSSPCQQHHHGNFLKKKKTPHWHSEILHTQKWLMELYTGFRNLVNFSTWTWLRASHLYDPKVGPEWGFGLRSSSRLRWRYLACALLSGRRWTRQLFLLSVSKDGTIAVREEIIPLLSHFISGEVQLSPWGD